MLLAWALEPLTKIWPLSLIAVDRGRLAHGGRAEGAEISHRAGGPAERVVLREPAGVLAALEKNTLSRYERPTTSPLAMIPKPRLTPPPRFPRSVTV